MEPEDAQPITDPAPENPVQEPEPTEEGGDGEGEVEGEGEGEGDAPNAEAPTFDFTFDDEKKKKKKSKKKNKKGQKSFSREFYETLIQNLNRQLGDLRKIFRSKDEVNLKLAKELAAIEVERYDVCEHLGRTFVKRETQIIELEDMLVRLQNEYADYKDTSRQRIDELQKLFANTQKQLNGEIELQERALSSLNEFSVRRDEVLARYQSNHDHVEDMERQCKETLFNLEQKNSVQKNVLKKEVKMRLNQVAEDFLHSSEIRNAGYTRNLIRENITLHKTLEKRVKQNISIMEQREKQFLKTKEVMESYSSLEQFTEHLEHTIENKNAIIKRLTGRIELMKSKFIDARRYRNLCDRAMDKGLFKQSRSQNLGDMYDHLEQLKTDKSALHWMISQQEPEIERITQVVDKLMSAVVMAAKSLSIPDDELTSAMSESDSREMHRVLRQNIVAELIPIVSGTTPGIEETPEKQQMHGTEIYTPGLCGFIPPPHHDREKPLTELNHNVKSEIWAAPTSKESTSLYGIEFGSVCYYSHTPTMGSSSMLSPVEECNSEFNEAEIISRSMQGNSIGDKYKDKRCSCPKKKSSLDVESVNKIVFKEPREIFKTQRPIRGAECVQHKTANCFSLDCYPYCSESSSFQDEKDTKSAKASAISASTFVSFNSDMRAFGRKKKASLRKCKCN